MTKVKGLIIGAAVAKRGDNWTCYVVNPRETSRLSTTAFDFQRRRLLYIDLSEKVHEHVSGWRSNRFSRRNNVEQAPDGARNAALLREKLDHAFSGLLRGSKGRLCRRIRFGKVLR